MIRLRNTHLDQVSTFYSQPVYICHYESNFVLQITIFFYRSVISPLQTFTHSGNRSSISGIPFEILKRNHGISLQAQYIQHLSTTLPVSAFSLYRSTMDSATLAITIVIVVLFLVFVFFCVCCWWGVLFQREHRSDRKGMVSALCGSKIGSCC